VKSARPHPVVTVTVSLFGALVWAAVLGGIVVLAVIGARCMLAG